MKKYAVLMIGAILSLLSCGTKAPKGDLLSLEFVSNGSRLGTEYEGRVEQDSNGTFMLTAMKMNYGPLYQKKIGKEEMNKFKKIIRPLKIAICIVLTLIFAYDMYYSHDHPNTGKGITDYDEVSYRIDDRGRQ